MMELTYLKNKKIIITGGNGFLGKNVVKKLMQFGIQKENIFVPGSKEYDLTEKYNIDKLIYYEIYSDPENAILREKQLKNWNRKKKINLIIKMNPKFEEITLDKLV